MPDRHGWDNNFGNSRPRPNYCQADADDLAFPIGPHRPCVCGATVSGNDPVRGVCQARYPYGRPQPLVRLVLVDKETGMEI